MSRKSIVIKQILFLLMVILIAQSVTAVPTQAKSVISPAEPVAPPAQMVFQPVADADEFTDFAPATAKLVRVIVPVADSDNGEDAPILATEVVVETDTDTAVNINDGQLGVVIEEGTFAQPVTLSIQRMEQHVQLSEFVSDAAGDHPAAGSIWQFQVEILDARGHVLTEFAKPVRLVVDLRSYGVDLTNVGGYFYLAYEDADSAGTWREVPVTYYGTTGLLSAEVNHFSNWQSGWRPEAWALEWKPPVVNEFTGAANYQYPFEIPPGRNGLQPSVGLSYSSAALRGAIRQVSHGTVATGWSLNDISITRTGIENGASSWDYPDTFRLTINGSGGRLIETGTEGDAVIFRVEDMPQIKVYNYGGRTWDDNQSGNSFWLVKDGNGITYRLGYTADAVARQGTRGINEPDYDYEIIAWHVDTVTDAYGNQLNYNYQHVGRHEDYGFWCPWGGVCGWEVDTYNSQIANITYNFIDRVQTPPAAPDIIRLGDQPGAAPASRITFAYDNNETRLSSISIYHGSGAHPVRRYLVQATTVGKESPEECDVRQADGSFETLTSRTRIVEWIEEQAIDPADGTVTAVLPRTTFSYDPLHHFTEEGESCFLYQYLTTVETGYGGSSEFTYESDYRTDGDFNNCKRWKPGDPPCEQEWPNMGYNYSVASITHFDGRNPGVKTVYSYANRCYDQNNDCPQPETDTDVGVIGGYGQVTATIYDFDGITPLTRYIRHYNQALETYGRIYQADQEDGSGVLLSRAETDYTVDNFTAQNIRFTYASTVTNTQYYQDGANLNSLQTVTRNYYDPANQGGQQWGLPTRQDITYPDSSGSSVTIHSLTLYRTNTTTWVAVPWAKGTYDSDWSHTLQLDLFLYDGNTNNPDTQLIDKGELTLSRSLLVDAPTGFPAGGEWYRSVDTHTTYDSYGNTSTVTTYQGYGEAGYDEYDNWTHSVVATAGAAMTSIGYDSPYHLYPVSVSTPLGQTSFQIYGFNGVALSGFQQQPGLLMQVTDPASITTKYEYDPFGRLHATYDGDTSTGTPFAGFGDDDPDNGGPVIRYGYWDNTWNNATRFLDPGPENHEPFLIAVEQRPGSYPQPVSSSSGYAFDEQTFYDGFGRPIQTRSVWNWVDGEPLSREIITSTAYDATGQVRCQTVPYDMPFYSDQGKVWPASPFLNESCESKEHTTTTYDVLGRPSIITAPDGSTIEHHYAILSDLGNPSAYHHVVSIVDANDHALSHYYDAVGQLAAVREYTGTAAPYTTYATTTYGYDLLGNLTHVWDGANNHTEIRYDALGRKTWMNDPDMGVWEYLYDATGNLVSQHDAIGQNICFQYDNLNRMTAKYETANFSESCPDGSNTLLASYQYYNTGTGQVGQVQEIQWPDVNNRETFSYDTLGRLETHNRWIDGLLYTMHYSNFDPMHRPQTITYPDGEVVTVNYDHEGANELLATNQTLVSNITYNARGQMTALYRGNGVDTSYNYYPATGSDGNNNYRLSRISHGMPSDGIPDFSYSYDKVGNVTSIVEQLTVQSLQTQRFEYDSLNRLVDAHTVLNAGFPAYDHQYSYDLIGNIQSITRGGNETTYTYTPAQHAHTQPHAVKSLGDGSTFEYDENGNMIERLDGTGNYTQVFDVENRLEEVIDQDTGLSTIFTYDAAGQRVKTVRPDGTVIYTPFPNYEEEFRLEEWTDVAVPDLEVAIPDNQNWQLAINDNNSWAADTLTVASLWTTTPDNNFPGTSDYDGPGVGDPISNNEFVMNVGSALALNNLASGQIESSTIELDGEETNYDLTFFLKRDFGSVANFGGLAIVALPDSNPNEAITIWETSGGQNEFSNTWQSVSTNFELPQGVRELQLQIVATQINGWAAFDALTLGSVSSGTIYSSSFETAAEWSEQPNANFPATSIWRGNEGPATAYDGDYSYLFSNLSATTLTSPLIEYNGEIVDARVWLRGNLLDGLSASEASFTVAYFDDEGQYLAGEDDILWQTSAVFYSGSWVEVGESATPPNEAASLELRLQSRFANGWLAFDDVVLTLTEPDCRAKTCDTVYTWDFNTPNQWSSSTQTAFPASSIWYDLVGRASSGGGSGDQPTFGYLLGNEASGVIESSQFAVTAGDSYQIEAWIRGDFVAKGSAVNLFATFLDSGGAVISQTSIWYRADNYSQAGWEFRQKLLTAPVGATSLRLNLDVGRASGWVAVDGLTLGKLSQPVPANPGQLYDLSAMVSGNVSHPGGQMAGLLSAYFYDSGGTPLSKTTTWQSADYDQSVPTHQGGQFTTPANTASLRAAYVVNIDNDAEDNGWLAVEQMALTAFSEPVNVTANRIYGFFAKVHGQVTAPAGEDAAHLSIYDANSLARLLTNWQTDSWSDTQPPDFVGDLFTMPAGTDSIRLGMTVHFDRGWLVFEDATVESVSDYLPVNGNTLYDLSVLVAGNMNGPAAERNGAIVVTYHDSNFDQLITGEELWNISSYNEPSHQPQGGQFWTLPDTAYVRIWLLGVTQYGWLDFTDLTLQEQTQIESTLARSTYSLAGQTIAVRNETRLLSDNFEDGNADGWTAQSGSWSVVNLNGNHSYHQSNASSARYSNQPVEQHGALTYEWTVAFESGEQKAGLHFFGSANDHKNHGNSYLIWQRDDMIRIYEYEDNSGIMRDEAPLVTQNEQTYDYRASYDPATGQIDVWRDGTLVLSWTDETPITYGNYVGLRTANSQVRFDNVQVSVEENLYYVHSDHLGSASATTDSNGNLVGNVVRYLPFGDYRTAPSGQQWEISDLGFTGHKAGENGGANDIGLIYMNARFYIPGIGRFASADTIVPDQERQELTVAFYEPSLIEVLNNENRQSLSIGPIHTWTDEQKQENGVPSGPTNPQLLNRYSYTLGNPLKYTDPSGHLYMRIELTAEQAQVVIDYLLGSNGDIGKSEFIYNIGQAMSLSSPAPTALIPGPWGVGLTIGAFVLGENAKETSNTLTEIANILQSEIDAGATTLSIEVEDLWWGDKITVSGLNAHAVSAPKILDSAGRVLKAWMFYVDNDAPVFFDLWESEGEFHWRTDDGSIAW